MNDVAGEPRRLWVTWETPRSTGDERAVVRIPDSSGDDLWDVLSRGCGVTGLDADDCWRRVRDDVFRGQPLPPVRDATFDIDVSTLDPDWVLPRLGNPAAPGVWFPAWNATPAG